MARTFNRAPLQVHTPTANERKTYQFNHYEWKGLCDDKSVLTTAPTTFANAQNVYHDREGLLRSRPAVKREEVRLRRESGSDIVLSNILKVKSFGDYNVFIGTYQTVISKNDVWLSAWSDVEEIITEQTTVDLTDNRIFFMSDNFFIAYDITNNVWLDEEQVIYVPTTKIYTGTTLADGESENILTTKHKEVYNYTSELGMPSEAIGKLCTFSMLGNEYSLTVNRNTPRVLCEKAFDLPSNARQGLKALVAQSTIGHMAYLDKVSRCLYFSTDGRTFSSVGVIPGSDSIVGNIKFSQDGFHVYVCTSNDVYIISVLRTEISGNYVYPVFTSIKTLYNDLFPEGPYTSIDADFYEYDNFVVVVKTDTEFLCIHVTEDSSTSTDISPSMSNGDIVKISYSTSYNSTSYDNELVVGLDNRYFNIFTFAKSDGSCVPTGESRSTYNIDDLIITGINVVIASSNISPSFRTQIEVYDMTGDMLYSRVLQSAHSPILSTDGTRVLTSLGIFNYQEDTQYNFLISPVNPVSIGLNTYFYKDSGAGSVAVLSDKITNAIPFTYTSAGQAVHKAFSFIATLSDKYVADGDTLYINEAREDSDGRFLWYLPKLNYKKFNYPITNLHPVSTNEMGIFFEDEIWLASYNSEIGTHVYTKTRLNIGCAAGNDVITSYDGSSTLFMTHRGLVSMGYQDFIASTEQSLTYLSNNIYDMLHQYNDGPIKLYIYDHWVVLYKQNAGDVYLFDSRNGSWWYWLCEHDIHQIYDFLHEPRVLSEGYSHTLSKDNKNYHDSFLQHEEIKWFIKSQPLYLGNPNAYKHVLQVILLFTEYEQEYPCQYVLRTLSYRDSTYNSHAKVTETRIDKIRTKVIRIDSPHLVEFDYCLSSYDTNDVPLSLSGITIKYKVGGDVR